MPDDVYCIDASSLFELRRRYPKDVFPKIWQNLDKLISGGRLIAPKEVREEIRQGDDELVPWAKGRKTMFKAPDKEQLECVKEIEAIFPSLVDPSKQTPQADPFVVALAHCGTKAEVSSLFQRKRIVVTEERRTRPHGIPQVCAHYNIECISLMDLFRREGWKF